MTLIPIIIEKIVNLSLSISNIFNLFSLKLIDKFNINIYKPKHEEEILKSVKENKQYLKKLLINKSEIKRYEDREKIIKEIISQDIININNLSNISHSEHFIIILKLHLAIKNRKVRQILFGENGSFENSIFKYFDEENFVKLGKQFAPVYIKDKFEMKEPYRNMFVFKKLLDNRLKNLIAKDNQRILYLIQRYKNRKEIKNFFQNLDVNNKKFLFLDYLIISSLNLNKENITIEGTTQKKFLFNILSNEAQNVKLKEIILQSGIKLFLNKKYPQNIRSKLLENEIFIKQKLKIENFFGEINKNDIENVLKMLLTKDYKQGYLDNFIKIQSIIKEL